MDICLVSPGYPPYQWGGVERYVFELQKYLVGRGHKVLTITRGPRDEHGNSVARLRLPSGEVRGYAFWAVSMRRILSRYSFDVLHGHDLFGHIASLVSNQRRLVVTPHNWFPYYSPLRRELHHRISYSIRKAAMKKSNLVIVPSQYVRKLVLAEWRLDPSRVANIPTAGVDLRLYNSSVSVANVKEKLGIAREPVIMYFGKISSFGEKGLRYIIEAFLSLEKRLDAHLVLAGAASGNSGFVNRAKLLSPRIHVTGFIPEEEVPSYLRSADVYCIFSPLEYGEGFTQTVVQAMACGVPIVCSDHPVFREETRGEALFVRPRDSRALAQALERLLSDDSLRNRLSRQGRLISEEFYSWETVLSKVERAYEAIV